jgi:CubicO group peptidase (beta-lactamase class C family)
MRRLLLLCGFSAILAGAPSAVLAAEPLAADKADAVRAFVRDAIHQLGVPGAAVVIVHKDGIAFAEGFGSARDDGTPATTQTPFEIASLSKELTSIAVMQLVESGELDLDTPVHGYIDWFGAEGSDTARITVRDLLAQTSGWSGEQGLTNRIDESNNDETLELNVRRLAAEPLDHPIGQFEYSNANYDTLGYLVAVVSGVSYEAYMTDHVLGPLQMAHTHLTDAEATSDGVAEGHYPFFGIPIAWEIPFVRGSVPSSFIAASAEDLGHVLIAHLNDGRYGDAQVLPAAAMARLRVPLTNPDPSSGYGWGWWSYPMWGAGKLEDGSGELRYQVPVILEHGGSHATYASGMVLLHDEGFGVVVLLNLNDELASSRFYEIHTGIAQILLDGESPQLTSYDDFLSAYGKLIGIAWVVALATLVAWSVRRYRRWGRDPTSRPRGGRSVTGRIVVPLIADIILLLGLWALAATKTQITPSFVLRTIRLQPDLGLILIVVTGLGLGWAVIGTAWSVRVLRRGVPV